MSEKIKLAVIGTGLAWERLHYPALQKLTDRYEVLAVCDNEPEKAKKIAVGLGLSSENVYSDYREMLKRTDFDTVDVLVPITENFEVARDVLLAGKNLIAEKPFASSPDAAKQLIELKNQSKSRVMVAENFRYDEGNRLIKDIISSGKLGEVFHFTYQKDANFDKDMKGDTFSAKEWRQWPEYYGGTFLDGGIHDIALMRFLFGDAEKVCAMGVPQQEDYCPYRSINCLIQFKNNVIGSFSYDSKGCELLKPPVGLRIYGTKGNLYLETSECGVIQLEYTDGTSEKKTYTPGQGYYFELLDYADGSIVSTPEKELGDIELVYAILDTIKNGCNQE